MGKYILKRLLYMIPMMFCVILMVFLIMAFTPGDPATNVLPLTAEPEVKAAFNERVGYSENLLERFGNYMNGLIHGNVLSYTTQENIFGELALRFPITIRVGLLAFCISAVIGVSLGIMSAIKQYSFLDTTVTIFAVLFASIPSFFVAMMLILYFAVFKGVLPSFGLEAGWRSYVLPLTTLVLASIPMLSRLTRSAMLDAMSQDYIRTARAKGCREKRVIWKHALKNASMPVLTLLITGLAGTMGGSVIVEQIFTIPGIGTYMLTGVNDKNVPVVMTCALVLSFIFMAAMVVLDVCYALIDPKIGARYKK